jgi:hypothetical protein
MLCKIEVAGDEDEIDDDVHNEECDDFNLEIDQ